MPPIYGDLGEGLLFFSTTLLQSQQFRKHQPGLEGGQTNP